MIRNKYKIEKKSELELQREDAAAKAADLRDDAADKAGDAKSTVMAGAAAAADKIKDAVSTGQDKVKAATPDVDKDSFVEDILPKLVELLAGAAAAGTTAKALRSDDSSSYRGYTGAQTAMHTGGDVKHDQGEDYTKMAMDLAKVAASFFASKKAASVATDKASDADLGGKLAGLAGMVQDKASDMDLGKKVAGAAVAKKAADKAGDMDLGKKAAKAGLFKKAVDATRDDDEQLDASEMAKKAAKAGVTVKALEKARKKEKKKGKGLITLGLLASAAAVAAVVYKQTAPQDDPWATPLADPYTGPSSQTIGTTTTTSTTSYATTNDKPLASTQQAGDPLSAVSTEPVILDAKDQEDYAASAPSEVSSYDRTDDGAGQHTDHNAGTETPDRDKF